MVFLQTRLHGESHVVPGGSGGRGLGAPPKAPAVPAKPSNVSAPRSTAGLRCARAIGV